MGSRGKAPCGYRAKPCRSLRQSLNRRKPISGAECGKKNVEFVPFYKGRIGVIICTAFTILLHNVKSAKSEAILRRGKIVHNCRGWRPRQPVSGSCEV